MDAVIQQRQAAEAAMIARDRARIIAWIQAGKLNHPSTMQLYAACFGQISEAPCDQPSPVLANLGAR